MQDKDDDLLTTADAAKLAGVSARTLIRWRDDGKLESVPIRRPVIEARPGIGWRRADVLRVVEKPVEPVSGGAATV